MAKNQSEPFVGNNFKLNDLGRGMGREREWLIRWFFRLIKLIILRNELKSFLSEKLSVLIFKTSNPDKSPIKKNKKSTSKDTTIGNFNFQIKI